MNGIGLEWCKLLGLQPRRQTKSPSSCQDPFDNSSFY